MKVRYLNGVLVGTGDGIDPEETEEYFIEFEKTLRISILHGGTVVLFDEERIYGMSPSEFKKMISRATIIRGEVMGRWSIVENGKRFSISWNPPCAII